MIEVEKTYVHIWSDKVGKHRDIIRVLGINKELSKNGYYSLCVELMSTTGLNKPSTYSNYGVSYDMGSKTIETKVYESPLYKAINGSNT